MIGVLGFFAGMVGADDFDVDALRDNARDIATDNAAQQLFTPAELTQLRALVDNEADINDIDQLLQTKAPIEISINPEARVSVKRTAAMVPDLSCDKPSPWLVRVVNQGFVTSSLNVFTDDQSIEKLAAIEIGKKRLTGSAVEYRILSMKLSSQPVGATLRFNAGNDTYDLGNRSRLSLLLRCNATTKG